MQIQSRFLISKLKSSDTSVKRSIDNSDTNVRAVATKVISESGSNQFWSNFHDCKGHFRSREKINSPCTKQYEEIGSTLHFHCSCLKHCRRCIHNPSELSSFSNCSQWKVLCFQRWFSGNCWNRKICVSTWYIFFCWLLLYTSVLEKN